MSDRNFTTVLLWPSGAKPTSGAASGGQAGSDTKPCIEGGWCFWGDLAIKLLAGLGGLLTAFAPVLPALLKFWREERQARQTQRQRAKEAEQARQGSSDVVQSAFSKQMVRLGNLTFTAGQWLFFAALLVGGTIFFAEMLFRFAVYLLLFIVGFILSGSVFMVAAAHARRVWLKTDMDQQRLDMHRERHKIAIARLNKSDEGSDGGASAVQDDQAATGKKSIDL